MVKKTEAERIGCIDRSTKEECEDSGDFNCTYGEKAGCRARKFVSRGRVYRSRDSDDFITLDLKPGDSISATRRAEDFEAPRSIPYKPKSTRSAKVPLKKMSAAPTGPVLSRTIGTAPKKPKELTSICATFEKDDDKCRQYAV
ncbi:MAG: hypothetical protein EOP45_14170 [Sphingobacteriaceae bacterium]|nr:MAG: hypothetical protein EOP45_14170 [Sphingobacteriaceae bacterium]